MKNILILEDDISLNKGIFLALKSSDCYFDQAYDIKTAKKFIEAKTYDLMIFDINLPDGNGLDLLSEVREKSHVPIIMLTANDMEIDIVTGLEMGADDYITKPFSLMVLRARVNTQLKKSKPQSKKFTSEDFIFDFENMDYRKNNEPIELSKTEQKLLRLLVLNRGNVLSRGDLVDKIWTDGAEYVDENALSVTIKRLRNKLEDHPTKPKYIKMVYGIGYVWSVN